MSGTGKLVITQRSRPVTEPEVRTAGVWGVALDFTKSQEQNNPRRPEFNRGELPPEIFVPGRPDPLLVYAVFTFAHKDEEKRRWTVEVEIFPRIKDSDALLKIDEHFVALKAYLMMLANDKQDPPEVGSRVYGYRYTRSQANLNGFDTPDQFFLTFDWSAGRRAARARQLEERERARLQAEKESRDAAALYARRATVVGGVIGLMGGALVASVWGGVVVGAIGALIGWRFHPRPEPQLVDVWKEVAPDDVVVPEVDPWELRFMEFNQDKRAPGVERLFHSLFSLLIVQEKGGAEALRAAGLGHVFHKTVVHDRDAPIPERLWGKGSRTVVLGN